MQLYVFAEPPVPYFEWLPEISVLLIMAGLLCISMGLERVGANCARPTVIDAVRTGDQ